MPLTLTLLVWHKRNKFLRGSSGIILLMAKQHKYKQLKKWQIARHERSKYRHPK
jgi:hypothetical protein